MTTVTPSNGQNRMDRRDFLVRGTAAGVGLLPLARTASAAAAPQVRRYVPLGSTGMKISDISFGGSRLGRGEENVVLHALDRGINYFDTAESYNGGDSETTIGNALRGKRDKVFLTSKVYAGSSERRDSFMRTLEESLRRLRTDHVDIYFNHAVNEVARVTNPEWHEFTAAAKKQGKIRFCGVSGHAGRLVECLEAAIASGRYDVILSSFNFGQDPHFYQRFTRSFDMIARLPKLPQVLMKAKQKGMGVVAMKTLMGARLNDMRPYEKGGATFAQAAFRWVLTRPYVDALIVSMTETGMVDEYLGASGWQAASRLDQPLLERYARLNGASYCRHACNDCAGACPEGVPIADVLRTRMYAVDYKDVTLARNEYALLGGGAVACMTCAHQACTDSCTHGLPVQHMLAPAHRLLAGAAAGRRSA